ncbi:MAG: M23 family metallopeptidase [Lachnospiraceae bacterium]|nr:M23 family metallopeptidase [Lachnospiraceae bacterium]
MAKNRRKNNKAKKAGSGADKPERRQETTGSSAPAEKPAEKSAGKTSAVLPKGEGAHHVPEHHPGAFRLPAATWSSILILFVILLILLVLLLSLRSQLSQKQQLVKQLEAYKTEADQQLTLLASENAELKKQVEALSIALNTRAENEMAQKEESAELALPTLYPLKSANAIMKQPSDTDDGKEPTLNFSTEEGSLVLASGNAVVKSIEENLGTYTITLDHQNGYTSIYSGKGKPLVNEGDDVARGGTLMIFTEDDSYFVYQIKKDGKALDPMTVMDIDG